MDPDNVVEIEIEEPPSPTPLEQMQERHQAYLRWCAAMLESSVADQKAVRRQLARARRRRADAMAKLQAVKCLRAFTAKLAKKHQRELNEVNESCDQLMRGLAVEAKWRPTSETMSQRHQQELRERVARLQVLLETKKQLRRV